MNLTTSNTVFENTSIPINRHYSYYLQITGEIIIATAAILTNAMVLVSIATTPKLQYITNYFVASLSTADMLVGLLGIPCVITAMHQKPNSFSGCLTVNSVIVILTQISIFSLLVIALERFYAIKYPFEYNRIITPFRSSILIALTWAISIFITLLPSFAWNLDKMSKFGVNCDFLDVIDLRFMVYFNFFGCVLTPLLIMAGLYFYIFRVVVKQRRIISASQLPASSSTTSVILTTAAAKFASHRNKGYSGTTNATKILTGNGISSKTAENDIVPERSASSDESENGGNGKIKIVDKVERMLGQQTYGYSHEHDTDLTNNGKKEIKKLVKSKVSFASDIPDANLNLDEVHESGLTLENHINAQNPIINDAKSYKKVTLTNGLKKQGKLMQWSISKTRVGKAGASLGKDIQAAKWFAVVLLCFAVCWLPLHTINCLTVFNGVMCLDCMPFFILLSHLNSAFNPVLYALGNSKFEAAFKRILGIKRNNQSFDMD